jgi:hypothetical protein
MKIAILAVALWLGMILVSALSPLWFGTGGPSAQVGYVPPMRVILEAAHDVDDERE